MNTKMNAKTNTKMNTKLYTLLLLVSFWGAGLAGASGARAQDQTSPQTPSQPATDSSASAVRDTVYITQPKAPFVSARPGFYLALAGSSTHIDISDDQQPGQGLEVDADGGGAQFLVGYAFHEGFALELSGVGSHHDTNRPDVDAWFAQLQLDAVTHFNTKGRVQPYVAGGIGLAAFGVEGTGIIDTSISGGQVDFGGGVEWMFARHWGLALDYRFAIQRFQDKTIYLDEDTYTNIGIEGSGNSSTWNLRVAFSF